MYCLDCQCFLSMFNIMPRRKENSLKVCVVAQFHTPMLIFMSRRKEKRKKVCVVAIRGRNI